MTAIKGRPWTEPERQILRQRYANTPAGELAKELGRSLRAVYQEAGRLKLQRTIATPRDVQPHCGHMPRAEGLLRADDSPIGMSFAQIKAALGIANSGAVSNALTRLLRAGRVAKLGTFKTAHFFSTPERAEACRTAYEAHLAALREAARLRRIELRRIREGKPPAVPKPLPKATPKPVKKPRHKQQPPVLVKHRPRSPASARNDLPIVIPAGVKIQRVPTGVDYRFYVPESFRGDFSRDWDAKRGKVRK